MIQLHVMIGTELKISEDDFESRQADCKHSFSTEDCNFCPYCGVAVTMTKPSKFSQPTLSDLIANLKEKLPSNFIIVKSMDNRIFVGLGMTSNNRAVVSTLWPDELPFQSTKKVLVDLLKDYELQHEEYFGFHRILEGTKL